MGWAPSISFKLRDDEITFGNLIIGKEIIGDIEKLILGIRNGAQVDTSFYQKIFNGFVFVDEEFEAVKADYEQIKIDYAYFRDVLNAKMRFDFSGALKHAELMANYAAGSATWLEKYGEMKSLAGDMYRKLKSLRMDFGEKEEEYAKRYAYVKELPTSNGPIVSTLEKQYREDMVNGVPGAAERYLNTARALGPVEEARAEANIRLLSTSALAGEGEVVSKAGTGEMVDGTNVYEEVAVQVHDKPISISIDMVISKIDDIYGTGRMETILYGLCHINELIKDWCEDVGIVFPIERAKAISECSPSTTLGEIKQNEKFIIDTLTYSANKALFDTDPRKMKESEWHKFGFPKDYPVEDIHSTKAEPESTPEEVQKPVAETIEEPAKAPESVPEPTPEPEAIPETTVENNSETA